MKICKSCENLITDGVEKLTLKRSASYSLHDLEARIFIDGAPHGAIKENTSADIDMAPGEHIVKVVIGDQSAEEEISISEGRPEESIFIVLNGAPRFITAETAAHSQAYLPSPADKTALKRNERLYFALLLALRAVYLLFAFFFSLWLISIPINRYLRKTNAPTSETVPWTAEDVTSPSEPLTAPEAETGETAPAPASSAPDISDVFGTTYHGDGYDATLLSVYRISELRNNEGEIYIFPSNTENVAVVIDIYGTEGVHNLQPKDFTIQAGSARSARSEYYDTIKLGSFFESQTAYLDDGTHKLLIMPVEIFDPWEYLTIIIDDHIWHVNEEQLDSGYEAFIDRTTPPVPRAYTPEDSVICDTDDLSIRYIGYDIYYKTNDLGYVIINCAATNKTDKELKPMANGSSLGSYFRGYQDNYAIGLPMADYLLQNLGVYIDSPINIEDIYSISPGQTRNCCIVFPVDLHESDIYVVLDMAEDLLEIENTDVRGTVNIHIDP